LAGEGPNTEQVDAELRRVAEAADGLVRSAQELRGALDSLSESVRAAIRDAATATGPAAAVEPNPDPEDSSIGDEPVREEPEGARIVALNMVLEGKSRNEVAAHLRDEFDFTDSAALLDDVYSRVG